VPGVDEGSHGLGSLGKVVAHPSIVDPYDILDQ